MNQDTKTLTRIEANTSEQFADWRDELKHQKENAKDASKLHKSMKLLSFGMMVGCSLLAMVLLICLSSLLHNPFAILGVFAFAGLIMLSGVRFLHYSLDTYGNWKTFNDRRYGLIEKNVAWLDKHGFSTMKKGA